MTLALFLGLREEKGCFFSRISAKMPMKDYNFIVEFCTMTKSKLIEQIALKSRLPKKKAEHIMDCIFDTMEQSLKQGRRIEIRGFGSFEVRKYKAYKGRNPRTGAMVNVQPKKLPFFKVGKELRERLNRSFRSGVKKSADAAGKKSKSQRAGMAA